MNKIEKVIIESFEKFPQQVMADLVKHTSVPRATLKRHLNTLISNGKIEAIGEGRARYYERISKSNIHQIAVYKSAKLVGFLGNEVGRYLFEYDKSYKGRKLDGLVEDALVTSATLFPIFENLIPESDRRNAYLKEGENLAEILLELKNTHGDFDFVSADFFKTDNIIQILDGRKKEEIGFFVPKVLKEEFQSFVDSIEKKRRLALLNRISKAQKKDPIEEGSSDDGIK
ncbi:MAG: Unknown protein [uncultured Sulfurovum sp.]|uniref:Uncharacterized protein n=1 Tax=uncultured Sulfurovum sp. TaxID=269237 RepID=A0A6S6RT63_9BACT|nr:MAG: Unknown protein [uncultured Sulfurovum sp.]